MINLPGYGDIPKTELEVDINVKDKDLINMDYKALRGAMIMQRYEEKRERNVVEESMETYRLMYSQHRNMEAIYTMADLMNAITTLPKTMNSI